MGSGLAEKRIFKRIRSSEVLGRLRLPETLDLVTGRMNRDAVNREKKQ